jgi:superfamily II DNA/RNA helicase
MPPPIQKLAAKFLNEPKRIEVARPATANVNIEQRLVNVRADKKRDVLRDILRHEEVKNAIVFSNRKSTVRELATSLKRSGFKVGQIHGDMDQSDRIAEFDRFKNDEINILVASDVAARGLDIKGVSHVFNYDVPWHPDDYVHRIGRTGRAGKTGIAISLVTREDAESIDNIQKLTGTKIAEMEGGRKAPPREEPAARAESPRRKAEPETREEKPRRERRPRRAEEPEARPAPEPRAEKPEPRAEKPEPRAEKPERRERAPRARQEHTADLEPADDGWNGPVPSFLGKGFGG